MKSIDRGESAVQKCLVLAFVLLLISSGCSVPANTFDIIDHRELNQPRRYRESFDEAYYDMDEAGNVNIVLRRRAPVDQDNPQELTQVIHIRSFWRPIPGQTVAERSQINARVSYLILAGESGASFEGAGAAFFMKDAYGSTLSGTLDHATLRPQRRLASGSEVFARAELTGAFTARLEPRQVVRVANEMDRYFGPLPAYQPPEIEKTKKRIKAKENPQ